MSEPAARRDLLLVGLGHVHREMLNRHAATLADVFSITVVAPRAGQDMSEALQRLAGLVPARRAPRFQMPEGVAWLDQRVLGCQALHRRAWLSDGRWHGFDAMSLNTGGRQLPDWAETSKVSRLDIRSGYSADRVMALATKLDTETSCGRIGLAGGTHQSLAIASALVRRQSPRVCCTLFWPTDAKSTRLGRILKRLAGKGTVIVPRSTVTGVADGRILTADGGRFATDHLIWAGPSQPSQLALCLPSAADEIGLRVNRRLEVASASGIFASGGVASLETGGVLPGWDAPRQAEVLACNLAGLFDRRSLRRYRRPLRRPRLLL